MFFFFTLKICLTGFYTLYNSDTKTEYFFLIISIKHIKKTLLLACISTCWLNSGRHRAEDASPKPRMGDKLLRANISTTSHNHSFAFNRCTVGKMAAFHVSESHVQTDISHLRPLSSLRSLTECFQ